LAVLIFEVLLNATSMFNHGNVLLPQPIDRVLRTIVVTPEMHRVHHSIEPAETNSNFGFNLPWWDRLFGTYRAQPAAGHTGMKIGIDRFRRCARLEAAPAGARQLRASHRRCREHGRGSASRQPGSARNGDEPRAAASRG
jgi:sterol desaturase/sphingolipid hydroxylase (fatty acid hydroxylase superfamily)